MSRIIPENELVQHCLAGKREYQRMLYNRYASVMLGVCSRYFQTRAEAEDALQEGFIKIFNKLKDFKGEGSLEGWIRRVMVTTSINILKSNMKHAYHSDVEEMNERLPAIETIESNIRVNELLELVQELPEGYRIVFNLYAIEGFNHKEIGEMLNITEGTSKSQLARARQALQQKLLSNHMIELKHTQ